MSKIFTLTLAANEAREIAIQGQYFELRTALYPVDVELLDRSGGVVSLIEQGEESDFTKDGAYETVRVTNGANAQTVKFWYGTGESGSRRYSGSVTGSVSLLGLQGPFNRLNASVLSSGVTTLAAANAARRSILVQNNDASIYLRMRVDGADPTTSAGLRIAPGGYWESPPNYAPTGAIKVIAESGTVACEALEA